MEYPNNYSVLQQVVVNSDVDQLDDIYKTPLVDNNSEKNKNEVNNYLKIFLLLLCFFTFMGLIFLLHTWRTK